jgi:hypothetical protein
VLTFIGRCPVPNGHGHALSPSVLTCISLSSLFLGVFCPDLVFVTTTKKRIKVKDWVPDEQAPVCMVCAEAFSALKRKVYIMSSVFLIVCVCLYGIM